MGCLLTLLQILEVFGLGQTSRSHEPMDYIVVDFIVGWYHQRTQAPRFDVGFMAAFLALKNEACFLKYTFQDLPMDRRYAR